MPDCFDLMSEAEWALMCRAGTHEGWVMQAEMSEEEREAAKSLVESGWLFRVKVNGFWWFTQEVPA